MKTGTEARTQQHLGIQNSAGDRSRECFDSTIGDRQPICNITTIFATTPGQFSKQG
jgi:hypothetical protein